MNRTHILKKLHGFVKYRGIAFLSQEEAIEYYRLMVDLIMSFNEDNPIEEDIHDTYEYKEGYRIGIEHGIERGNKEGQKELLKKIRLEIDELSAKLVYDNQLWPLHYEYVLKRVNGIFNLLENKIDCH